MLWVDQTLQNCFVTTQIINVCLSDILLLYVLNESNWSSYCRKDEICATCFWYPYFLPPGLFIPVFFCWQEKHPSYTVLKTTHFSGLYCFKKTWIGPLLYNMWDKHHWRTAVLLPSEKIFGLFCLWPGTNILEGNDPELVLHLSDANFHIHLPMGKL